MPHHFQMTTVVNNTIDSSESTHCGSTTHPPPTENYLKGSRLLLRPLSLSVSVSQSQPLSFSVSQSLSLSLSVFRDLNFNPKLNTSKLSLVKFVSRTDHHLGNIDGHVNLG